MVGFTFHAIINTP